MDWGQWGRDEKHGVSIEYKKIENSRLRGTDRTGGDGQGKQGQQILYGLRGTATITDTPLHLTKAIRSYISRLHLAAWKDNCLADRNIPGEN